MFASPAAILRSCLIDLGLVQLPGTPTVPGNTPLPGSDLVWCFVGSMPDDYDKAVLIRNSAGLAGGREMRGGRRHPFPGVVLVFRDLTDAGSYALANLIATAVDQNIYQTATTPEEDGTPHYVQAITRTSSIASLGEEVGKKRVLHTFNARMSFQDREPQLG